MKLLVDAVDIAVAGSCDFGDFIDFPDVDPSVVETTPSGIVVGDLARVELLLDLKWQGGVDGVGLVPSLLIRIA